MSKGLQKACKELRVITVEAQEAVWQLAPRDWIGKRKAAITGVARRLGWTFARTWNIAHGRARRIDAHEMDRLRAELARLEQLKAQGDALNERFNALIYARHDFAAVRRGLAETGASAAALPEATGTSGEAGGSAAPGDRAATQPRG